MSTKQLIEDSWLWSQIVSGPSASLYENLQRIKVWYGYFSDDEMNLGINSLFFGLKYAEDMNRIYLGSQSVEKTKERLGRFEVDKDARIAELREDRFFLPRNAAELLRNERIIWEYFIDSAGNQSAGCGIMSDFLMEVGYWETVKVMGRATRKIRRLMKGGVIK